MATSFLSLVKSFAREERGASFVEYAVLTALMVAVVVVALGTLSGDVTQLFTRISTAVDGVSTTAVP
jgi:pilus assembly protein Flp/PilA